MNPTYDFRLPYDPRPARRPGTYPIPSVPSDWYALSKDVQSYVAALNASIALKQDILVSGTSIKTINGSSILGSGNLVISTAVTSHASSHAATGSDPVTPASIGAVAASYVTSNLMQRKSANDVDTNFMLTYQVPGKQTQTNVLHYDSDYGYGWYFNGVAANALVGYYLKANGSQKYLQINASTGRPEIAGTPGGTPTSQVAFLSDITGHTDADAVHYSSDSSKTDAQKSQARSNIGAGTYSKPSGGIPASDMSSAVQTSLGKADSSMSDPGTVQSDKFLKKNSSGTLSWADAGTSDYSSLSNKPSVGGVTLSGNKTVKELGGVALSGETSQTVEGTLTVGDLYVGGTRVEVVSAMPASPVADTLYFITGS